MRLQPRQRFVIRVRLQPRQPIRRRQHAVDFHRLQPMSTLRCDEPVLHHMRQGHNRIQPDDSRRALQRVRRTHQRFQRLCRSRSTLQVQQLRLQHAHLLLRLHAEEFKQREIF